MALAARSRRPQPAPAPEPDTDLAAFTIGGHQVLVDLRDASIGYDDYAVVISYEGELQIRPGPFENERPAGHNARTQVGPWVVTNINSVGGVTRERLFFIVLGRIIEPGQRRRRFA